MKRTVLILLVILLQSALLLSSDYKIIESESTKKIGQAKEEYDKEIKECNQSKRNCQRNCDKYKMKNKKSRVIICKKNCQKQYQRCVRIAKLKYTNKIKAIKKNMVE